ncbi:MAG: glycine--tRNA ligase subunit beta [Planctomycetota bacterium]|jgi:glycyl-tRNA synthetase beta chain
MADLLLELGVEELPATRIRGAVEALRAGLLESLAEAGLVDNFREGDHQILATPRRLAVSLSGVSEHQADREERVWGPPVRAAFDGDGNPTKAGSGFAASVGMDLDDLQRGEKVPGKPEYLFADRTVAGRSAAEILADALPEVLKRLPFRRTMRWPQSDLVFARPIRRLVFLLDEDVIPCTLAGCEAGRETAGHAFLDNSPRTLAGADRAAYIETLREGKVIVDMEERRTAIADLVRDARTGAGGVAGESSEDDSLVEEVAGLVEWPHAVVGSFEERYLELPDPVLVTSMAHHLRYFPVRGEDGRLANRFVSITDREDGAGDGIRRGNERVLRARLYDAAFFFENDRKGSLEDFRPRLDGVQFHRGLGSLLEKSDHVGVAVAALADRLGLDKATRKSALRAAHLLKCDLLSEMVGEFPELQGVMGREYTDLASEPASVGLALEGQYLPRGTWDEVLDDDAAALVSLAEKADSLAGYFSIGAEPSGSADPYGLRRHALGLLRILAKKEWPLSLEDAVAPALQARDIDPEVAPRLHAFLWARAEQEARSHGFVDFVDVVGAMTDRPYHEYRLRLTALRELSASDGWKDLCSLVERTGNMGRDTGDVDRDVLPEEAVIVLDAVETLDRDETGNLVEFATAYGKALSDPVEDLFEKVLVDDPEAPERSASLKQLLFRVYSLFRDPLGDLRRLGSGAKPAKG